MAFDNKSALNHAIRYLTQVAERRAAGGWLPPKERERQQRDAMRQEQQQTRQFEKQQQAQQKQLITDEKERQKNLMAWHKQSHDITKNPDGTPKVFYHGGPQPNISQFESSWGDVAGFFAFNPAKANKYVGHQGSVYPVYIQAKKVFDSRNPKDVQELHKFGHTEGWPNDWGYQEHTDHVPLMKKAGFDAYIDYEHEDGEKQAIVPFEPHQIKSASGNQGTFDPSNPDITKSEGGPILSKQYPTHYMPNVGRQVMQGGGVPDDDNLMVVHNTSTRKLTYADKLGGLAVPSLAIIKPSEGFHNFGNISLIGHPDMAKPSRDNPVFASDVYSPRFPSIDEDTGKIFKGFTPSGYRRYAPATLENIVKEMKGKVRGQENWNYGAGSVRSAVTPKFKDQKQMKKSANRIVSEEQFKPLGEETNDKLWELAGKFHPYSKYSGNRHEHADDFANMLAESVTRGHRSITEHHTEDLPPEHLDEAREFLNYLRDMPTAYFEAKPQRAVGIHEFQGAVVPEDELEDVKPILDKHGINRVVTYGGETDQERKANRNAALSSFSDLKFARGGYVDKHSDQNVKRPKKHPALSIAGTHIREEEHGEPIFTGRL